jgi:hypothetical protein
VVLPQVCGVMIEGECVRPLTGHGCSRFFQLFAMRIPCICCDMCKFLLKAQ